MPVPTSTRFLPTASSPGGQRPVGDGDRAELEPLAVVRRPGARRRACRRGSGGRSRSPAPTSRSGRRRPRSSGRRTARRPAARAPRASRPRCRRGSRRAARRRPRRAAPSRSPAVSAGRIRSVITPNVGPASSSLTIRNVVAPVTSSPAQIECCTGAAPRQAGSTEKCRLTQPWTGMSSADCGSSAPYATTGQQSGASARSASWNSGSRGCVGLEHRDAELLGALRRPGWRPACGRGRPGRRGG